MCPSVQVVCWLPNLYKNYMEYWYGKSYRTESSEVRCYFETCKGQRLLLIPPEQTKKTRRHSSLKAIIVCSYKSSRVIIMTYECCIGTPGSGIPFKSP